MAKKVYELAKEMGITSKELIARAEAKNIAVKNHMSVLNDEDVRVLSSGETHAQKNRQTPKHGSVPFGKPIINEEMLANRKKHLEGKPVVNESFLAEREKAEIKGSSQNNDASEKEPSQAKAKSEKTEEKQSESIKKKKETQKKTENDAKKNAASSRMKPSTDKKTVSEKASESSPVTSSSEEKQSEKLSEEKKATKKEDKASVKKSTSSAPQAEKKNEAKKEMSLKKEEGPETVKTVGRKIKGIPEVKIKIVKPAAQVQKEEAEKRERLKERRQQKKQNEPRHPKKNRRDDGQDAHNGHRGRKNEEGGSDNRRNDRGRHAGHNAVKPEAPKSTENRNDRRRGRKDHGRPESGRDKFAKFEKRSLEKKERKKYTKPKQHIEEEVEEEVLPEGTIKVNVPITVAGFCEQADVSVSSVIMSLMKQGVMANINQNLDEDTLMVLADDLGINVVIGDVEQEEHEEGIEDFKDNEKDLKPRPPIITVMGHVDHGKTSLLDAIRETNVTAHESGGITQHIGASEVQINGQKIVFLDTPGHEAFTAMRARGAHITDIAVLVVAADDSVMPQTIESISHAKAAGVPIIVAINKIDKPGANPDRVKKDLADHGVLVEDWGGDVISVPVSAKTGEGITNLLEMILLQAEVLELKANPKRLAMGSVIEARLDKAKGPVATLLVTNGTLQAGQSLVAGTCSGRIRLMTDYKGKKIKKAGPATAVEILGLTDVPQAGDEFNVVRDDKTAREIAEHRKEKLREETMAKNSSMTLEKMFSQMKEGEVKELNLIVKADVQGSVGAMISSLEKLNNDEVKVNVIHSGVGTVTESDVMLAETSNAVIIGFNVRPSSAVTHQAENAGVEIRLYRVIYDVIDDVEAAMKGMLDPEFKEEVLGKAEIRDTFKVPGVGIIGGAYVTEGKVMRNADIRLVRDGIVIHEGKISSLKRYKDDAKEVAQGYECGIGIEDYNDIKVNDVLECFHMVEIKKD